MASRDPYSGGVIPVIAELHLEPARESLFPCRFPGINLLHV